MDLSNKKPDKPLSPSGYVKGSPRAWLVKRLRSMGKASPAQVGGYPSLSPLSRTQNQASVPPVDVQGEAQWITPK